jgi:alanyl aminopeptidase
MLILLLASANAQSPRLTDPVTPTSLSVELRVDPAQDTFSGTATLGVEFDGPLDALTLHAEELTVSEASFIWKGRKRVSATVERLDDTRLRLVPDEPLKSGAWTVEIPYSGLIHEQPYGLYRFTHDEQPYLITQLEADEARTVWPCLDEPGFKVTHQLTVTAPEGLAVITNGPELDANTSDGWTRHRFATTPAIPTYGGVLAVGPYQGLPVDGLGVPSTIWTPAGQTDSAALVATELPRVVSALEQWFGLPYPYAKLDIVAVPSFAFGAMENPGAVVINGNLIPEPGRETDNELSALVSTLSHEVAHMWFGNLVTMAWWDDLWLNESFASWLGNHVARELHPGNQQELDTVDGLYRMLTYDGQHSARPLRTEVDPAAVYETANFAVYAKGEALLDQLESWLGPEVFQRGVRAYIAAHSGGNAAAQDLFDALASVSDNPVGEVLLPYLDTPGAPHVRFGPGQGGRFTLTQQRYQRLGFEGEDSSLWPVVLRMRVGRPDGSQEVVTVRLDEAEQDFDLGELSWLMPAAEGRGYYVWSLADAEREALIAHASELSPVEQVALIDDFKAEVSAGERGPASVLELVGRFGGEADPAVLRRLVSLVWHVQVVEDLGDPEAEELARAWMRQVLRPHLDAVGLSRGAQDSTGVTSLRRSLLYALAWAEDPEVVAYAIELAQAKLADPAAGDPELTRWALLVYVDHGDAALQAALFERAGSADLPGTREQYYRLGASIPGPQPRERALALALDPDLPVSEMFALIRGTARPAYGHDDVTDANQQWLMDHHDYISSRMSPAKRMHLANTSGCDLARLERARAFYTAPERTVPGVERVLAESEDYVKTCIAQRDANGPSVVRFLEDWQGIVPGE